MPKKVSKILLLIPLILVVFSLIPLAYAGNPPDAAHSSLNATEVLADGVTQSTITVVLEDSSGNPLAGDTVQISNTSDPTLTIATSSAVLDASGSATFTATSTTAGTDPIDVTDTTTSTLLSDLGNIIFDPVVTPTPTTAPTTTPSSTPSSSSSSSSNSTNTSCTNTAPSDAPNLYQVTSSNGSATLYFSPPSAGFDSFTISYGLDAKADSYNANLIQGPTSGALTYTVNALTPDTIYYFKVRANSGCAPGPWSSVVNSNSGSGGGTTSTPVTGPADVLYLGFAGLLMSGGGVGLFLKFRV